jgi:hypothetical protein
VLEEQDYRGKYSGPVGFLSEEAYFVDKVLAVSEAYMILNWTCNRLPSLGVSYV